MRISRCGLPSYISSLNCGKRGGAMVEAVLLEIIYLLLFGLVGVTIIAIILTIVLTMVLNNKEKTHL